MYGDKLPSEYLVTLASGEHEPFAARKSGSCFAFASKFSGVNVYFPGAPPSSAALTRSGDEEVAALVGVGLIVFEFHIWVPSEGSSGSGWANQMYGSGFKTPGCTWDLVTRVLLR